MNDNENNKATSYLSDSDSWLSTNHQSVVKGFDPASPEVKQAVEQLDSNINFFDPKVAYIGTDGQVYPTYEASPDYLQEEVERHAHNDIEFKRR